VFYVCATHEVLGNEKSGNWIDVIRDCLGDYPLETEDIQHLPVYYILTHAQSDAPFRVYSPHHVALSLWETEGLSHYTGLNVEQHLLLYLHLALLQRKALLENPLLKQEDLNHPVGQACLFNRPATITDYAQQLEGLTVCEPCRAFYQCLSCERELEQLTAYRRGLELC
jgi:hypothetical protein